MSTQTPYELLGGEAGLQALCAALYRIMDQSPEATGIRAMHAESLEPVEQTLFEYLSGWMGGPMLRTPLLQLADMLINRP